MNMFRQREFCVPAGCSLYAQLYQEDGLKGGHVILLNGVDSPYYEATKAQALAALRAYPGGLQIGGGIHPENAAEYLDARSQSGYRDLLCIQKRTDPV